MVEAVLALVRPAVELAVVDYGVEDEDDASDGDAYDGDEDDGDDSEDDGGDGLLVGDYGGLPLGTDWPVFQGAPLVLVARLRCEVLAELLGAQWSLPADGSLLFFNDDWHRQGDGACRVLHVPDGAQAIEVPDGAQVIPALPLGAWRRLSVPELAAAELDEWSSKDVLALMDVLEAARSAVPYAPHQVLGWLGDGYYPDAAGCRPLLQLEGEQGTSWGSASGSRSWCPRRTWRPAGSIGSASCTKRPERASNSSVEECGGEGTGQPLPVVVAGPAAHAGEALEDLDRGQRVDLVGGPVDGEAGPQ
ncbi:hypothetical protein GCM10027610_108510 [Dactylosporangium cerinum]